MTLKTKFQKSLRALFFIHLAVKNDINVTVSNLSYFISESEVTAFLVFFFNVAEMLNFSFKGMFSVKFSKILITEFFEDFLQDSLDPNNNFF